MPFSFFEMSKNILFIICNAAVSYCSRLREKIPSNHQIENCRCVGKTTNYVQVMPVSVDVN